mgnify:CR=1 FL=1
MGGIFPFPSTWLPPRRGRVPHRGYQHLPLRGIPEWIVVFFFGEACGIFLPMAQGKFILREREHEAFVAVLRKLVADAYAKAAFLIDKNGTLMASAGETAEFDTTSLASLAAGNIAATGGLANLIGEKEFTILFHEGERDHMHLSVVANRLILVVVFDRRSSVGLVRLRVRRASEDLVRILAAMMEEAAASEQDFIEELTEADIESLFR